MAELRERMRNARNMTASSQRAEIGFEYLMILGVVSVGTIITTMTPVGTGLVSYVLTNIELSIKHLL